MKIRSRKTNQCWVPPEEWRACGAFATSRLWRHWRLTCFQCGSGGTHFYRLTRTPPIQSLRCLTSYVSYKHIHICRNAMHYMLNLHMKNPFPKCGKRQSKNRRCDANAKFGDHILEKNSSCTHICIREKLFTKNTIFELGIGIASSFGGMALNTFRKRALHIDIYMYASIRACLVCYGGVSGNNLPPIVL